MRHRELGDVDEPFEIRRDKSTEIVNAVVSKGLRREDAGVVDNDINRPELPNSDVDNFASGSSVADVAVYQHKLVGRLQLGRLCRITRCAHYVIATFQESLDYCGADSLRGSRHDYCFSSICHRLLL